MNSHLMEIISREVIKSLPREQREMYEYVVKLEDELAQQAATAEEFMALLVKHSPHRKAAKQFNLTFGQLIKAMHQIEHTINEQMELKLKSATWKEITELVNERQGLIGDKVKYFYFSLNEVHS